MCNLRDNLNDTRTPWSRFTWIGCIFGRWIVHWYAALNSDWSITFGFFRWYHISAGYVAWQINIQLYGFSMSIHELGQSFQKWCNPLNCPRCFDYTRILFWSNKAPLSKMNPMKFEQTLCNLHKSSEILINPVQFKWTLWDLDKPCEIQTNPVKFKQTPWNSNWTPWDFSLKLTMYKTE